MEKKKKTKSYCFKLRVKEKQQIIDFAEKQSNFNDAIRYLIEKEIAENGIRNLANYIPAERNFTVVKNTNSVPSNTTKEVSNIDSISNNRTDEKTEINKTEINKKDDIKNNVDILSCYED